LFREEKLSVMIVSGPGIEPGALMGEARYSAESGVAKPTDSATQPIMLDVAPTALGWLGYGDTALEDFARDGFPSHLDRWVRGQHADILLNLDNIDNLNDALRSIGFDDVRISDFRARLARLLEFLPGQPPPLPSYEDFRIDGNHLRLQ
jgi:hypothetical protein